MAHDRWQRFSQGFSSLFSTLTCVHRPFRMIREKLSSQGP